MEDVRPSLSPAHSCTTENQGEGESVHDDASQALGTGGEINWGRVAVTSEPDERASGLKALTSSEQLKNNVQQMVEDINAKRKRDTAVLEEFKKSLDLQASAVYNSVETAMFSMYERNSSIIQQKLQELMEVLDRIAGHEAELEEFKKALGVFYSDLQNQPLDTAPTI